MGKTSKRRPCLISRAREELQWALAYGTITFEEYARRKRALDRKENK